MRYLFEEYALQQKISIYHNLFPVLVVQSFKIKQYSVFMNTAYFLKFWTRFLIHGSVLSMFLLLFCFAVLGRSWLFKHHTVIPCLTVNFVKFFVCILNDILVEAYVWCKYYLQWEFHKINPLGHFKNVYGAFIIYILSLKWCTLTNCYRMRHIEYNDNNEQIIKRYVYWGWQRFLTSSCASVTSF